MKVLPLGTVVQLRDGVQKLMIVSRTPLYNQNGTIGYFDYGACLYPRGLADQNAFFFNAEDIKFVLFEGFQDEDEQKYNEQYAREAVNIKYPKLQVAEATDEK